MILCMTGTGTDVGKTIATAALAAAAEHAGWHVRVAKPIQTGEPAGHGDLATVESLTGISDLHECARYPEPLAPVMAARRAGIPTLDLADVAAELTALSSLSDATSTLLLVEGAGGLMVELGEGWTIADLARELSAPLVVTTTTGLGSLNHALLTLEAIERRGVGCAGLIGGSVPADPDLATGLTLEEFSASGGFGPTRVPWLGGIPQGAGALTQEEFVRGAHQWISLPRELNR